MAFPSCRATDARQWFHCCACHPRECLWIFDLNGIGELYRSYEAHSFWPFLSAPTQGICVNFVRAEHSSYHWSEADLDRLAAYGHCVHTLSDAGLHSLGVRMLCCYRVILCCCIVESPDHHTFCLLFSKRASCRHTGLNDIYKPWP